MASSTPEVVSARIVGLGFTHRGSRLTITLEDGRIVSAPLSWYPRLQDGRPRERKNWRIIGQGAGIHWPDLDEDVSVENLLTGKPSLESRSSFERWLAGRHTNDTTR